MNMVKSSINGQYSIVLLNYQEGNVSIFCLCNYRIWMWKRVSISFYCTACCMHCICLIVVLSKIDVVLSETSSHSLSRQMMTSHLPAFPACPPYPQSVQAYYCNTWTFCTPLARCEANGPVPSEKRASRVEFGSQKLRAWGQPTTYAQWMTMTRCANVSIGLQRKGWRETIAIRVALVHTGHSQGRPFNLGYPGSWAESAQFCTANQIPSDNLMQLSLGIPVAHYSLHGQCRTWGATFSMSALRTDVH